MEVLLYDFTAGVGDTLWCGYWAEDEYISYNIVDSVSIEHIGGVDRKKLWFGLEYHFVIPYALETWIEGIGSNLGLLHSGSAHITGAYHRTLCFHQNGELVWQNPDYDGCTFDDVEENMNAGMVSYPNPTKRTIRIETENMRNIAIYNNLGERIFETETSGGSFEYDFGDGKTGLYIVKVRMSDGSEFSERIIKE
ncbi:MAG: T9SS type A sorting domain-containing protein [bacterium]|nr:T9SS type A sorting domain-containing protein [Candidatus Limimorpha caballi]